MPIRGEKFRETLASLVHLIPTNRLRVERAWGFIRGRLLFKDCTNASRVCAFGYVNVINEGTLILDKRIYFSGGIVRSEIKCHGGAILKIGSESQFNYGVSIEAFESINIGKRCMIASYVRICDRNNSKMAPISIGNDVWLAHGAIIGPGITIGDGSVVSAGSVVINDVPPGSLAIGNPARSLKLDLVAK